MGEFASKGVAGTGLGLGIAGTALGVLSGGANGLLGGLWNNNTGIAGGMTAVGVIAQKDARIAELEAQQYSDKTGIELYQKTLENNKLLKDELLLAFENQLKSENEKSILREKLVRSELGSKIDNVALTCGNGLNQLNGVVASITNTLNQITQQVIPQSAICPPVMPRYNSWTAPTTTTTDTTS